MRLQVVHDLQTMLQRAEEPVRVRERSRIVPADVPLVREDQEGTEGVGLAEAFVATAVHDLQQLDRELDVADAAVPRFTSIPVLPEARTYSSSRTFTRRTSSISAAGSSSGNTNADTASTNPEPSSHPRQRGGP